MAAQWRLLRDPAVRAVLRSALQPGHRSQRVHEDVGDVAHAGAADAGLRDHPLPADGCRHPVPPRLRVHAGDPLRAGRIYGIVFSLASLVQKNFKDLGQGGLVAIMLLAAFLFQPVRNWIQERLDRYFYRDRYDYRQTLVEFARELSSETNLDEMLAAVAGRLRDPLSIR